LVGESEIHLATNLFFGQKLYSRYLSSPFLSCNSPNRCIAVALPVLRSA
jgi:hypothetical protein